MSSSKNRIIPDWNIEHHIMALDIFMPIAPLTQYVNNNKKQDRNSTQIIQKKQ